ncbi:UNVERIFIED_CONTAM: hypothetical protein GTU68_052823 [Idotea baltica]|nr:hypothetical protein [Idotea baltica]
MEIVNPKSAILSNYEVYSLLQGISKHDKKKNKPGGQVHLANIAYDTVKYLEGTPCNSQNPEMIQSFLTSLPKRGFKLTKAEKLQLINLRPTTPVEMQLIVEDSEERLSEEQIEELSLMVQEFFPLPQCPNGT